MSKKSLIIKFYLIALVAVVSVNNSDAFNLMSLDVFRNPLGEMTEKLFNWNPFKTISPATDFIKKTAGDLESLFDTTMNSTRRSYEYGCECSNFTCSCCSHIEISKIGVNNTGKYFYMLVNSWIKTRIYFKDA